jgi:hypothetical protein
MCVCVSNFVCDLETSTMRQPRSQLDYLHHRNKNKGEDSIAIYPNMERYI